MIRIGVAFIVCLISIWANAQTLTYDDVQKLELVESGRENSDWAMKQPYVIMLSIDGFRYDYVQKYGAKNIQSIIDDGASSSRMIPSFPSKTFPNHYTLVTGMLPGHHGLVGNEFYSREKDYTYQIRDKSAVTDGSWYGGVPLWVLAERNQMLSANFFWVGSEAAIGGVKSTYSYSYNGRIANEHRVDKMMDWLSLPDRHRPHMILGYFSLVDDAGHRYGPDHEKTKEAVLEIDRIIGKLIKEVSETNLDVNIVLVSDHGMATINRGIVLPEKVDLDDARVTYSFPPMIYQPDQEKLNQLYEELLKVDNISVYKRNQIPDYLRFQNDDRIGDLILLSDAPTIIVEKPKVVSGGTHGFDPYSHVDMGALFCANGPQVVANKKISPVENIHIYPFVAQLLGLPLPDELDGDLTVLCDLIRK